MAIRAPSQELYSALFSGEAMKEALQWDDSIQGSGPNDSWRTESRDEYRGHHWVARSPCWAPTSAREPHSDLGSTIPRLQRTDRKEADCHLCASGTPAACEDEVSHEFCSLAFREALEAKSASRSPQAHCTQTIVVGIDRARDDPGLPPCSIHNFCKLQQQQQQRHERRSCCRCSSCCCKHRHRKEDMSPPAQQQQEQREQEQQQTPCRTSCEARCVKQQDQQQQQQHRRPLRGYLPSRGGLGRRRNEALLQRVGGGYQLYGPISWASFKKVDAQTNTPIDAARHAATQTAAEAALAAAATAGGATQAAAPAAAAAGERHTPKRKEARWYPRQQRCVAGGSSVPGRVKVPSASLEGPSSCCCCCCCCSGSQDTEAHVAAAGSKRYCLPFTAGPATATTAAASAAAAEGMPTVTLEPRENIRAATASAHRCRSTIRRGSRLQQQQQQQHQQQQEMLQGFCGCSCRKTSRGPLFASSKFPGGAQGSSLFEAAEAGPQTGLSGGPPSVLQGYAGLLPEFPRGPAMQSQQAVRRTTSAARDAGCVRCGRAAHLAPCTRRNSKPKDFLWQSPGLCTGAP